MTEDQFGHRWIAVEADRVGCIDCMVSPLSVHAKQPCDKLLTWIDDMAKDHGQ